jgi:CBS domain containing-hemolysin-like protein
MNDWLLQAIAVLACLTFSFFLSGMEAGVLALNRLRIRQRMRTGDRQARVLHGFLENPENFLWTILVGNTLANCFTVFMVAAGLQYWFGDRLGLFALAFAVFLFLLYALGDLLPKMLFQALPNRLCLALAGPFKLIHFALSPLVGLVTWFAGGLLRWTGGKTFTGRLFGNREELRLIMQETGQSFSSEEKAMINHVLDLQNLTVRQVIIPLGKVVTVSMETPMTEVLRICKERHLTRLLVEQNVGGRHRILGLVSLKTALYRPDLDLSKTAGDYVKPALYLNENLRLEDALKRMQRSGQRMAVVLDSTRREAGIVSLEDVLRSLFGEVSL